MRNSIRETPVDRAAILVWVGLVGAGAVAWFGSGRPIAGVAIVVAVLFAAGSPSGALYATCAAIPLIFHPIAIGSMQLGLLELGILATALGTAIRVAYDSVNGNSWSLGSQLQNWVPLALGCSLLVVGTLSLLWMPFTSHRAEALRSWRWVIVEPLVAFVLARFAISRDGRAQLALAISIPAGLIALAAIWQLGEASSGFAADNVHRSTVTYLHPNNLALFLERALFLALVPAVFLRGWKRWVLAIMAAVMLAGIGATFSRGALLGLAAGGTTLLLAHPMRKGWRLLGGGLVVAVAAFAIVASQRLVGAGSSGIVSTRRYLWIDAISMIRDFPLRGIGLDQFLWVHQQRYIDPRIWSERYTSHPHNLLLDCWLSLGLPGVVLMVAFLVAGSWMIWLNRSGRISLDAWQLGALALLGAGLGHGMVDNGYFLPDLAVMTWLSIAILTTPLSNGLEHRVAHD